MYLDLEVPYQEISAGLGADLRSMARQCEFLVFQPREVGKRRRKEKGGKEMNSFTKLGRLGPAKGTTVEGRSMCRRLYLAARRGNILIFNHVFSVVLY